MVVRPLGLGLRGIDGGKLGHLGLRLRAIRGSSVTTPRATQTKLCVERSLSDIPTHGFV